MAMKLSDAIRLGAMVSKQLHRNMIDRSGRTCALGSAAVAMGLVKDGKCRYTTLLKTFPALRERTATGRVLQGEIMYRNDNLRHTRERIADWLDTLDIDQESRPLETTQPVVQAATTTTFAPQGA